MRALGDRFVWGLREAAWQVDEKVVWPATDAIQYVPGRDRMPPSERESWWGRHAVDLAIAAGLAVVGFLLRRDGLPTDGLWLDDSIVGAGLHASVHDLLPVSADHPGYQAGLIGWNELTGGNDATLAYPTLARGALSRAAVLRLRALDRLADGRGPRGGRHRRRLLGPAEDLHDRHPDRPR